MKLGIDSGQNFSTFSVVAARMAAQFILDCTSLNLPNGFRIDISHPGNHEILIAPCQYCYIVNSDRVQQLKKLNLVQ